ncbi:MAG: folate-binding protein YgfZ [Hyphomicrobiaceae bacterium]|jgi:tRNA-modifying protein YgfZ
MPTNNIALLPDRGIIQVSGNDAETLLDGLLTNSLTRFGNQTAIHTGLLSPQGKILFDFFLVKTVNGFLIDVDKSMADDLIKRLSFYRLRADVQFENVSETMAVAAVWPEHSSMPGGVIAYPDPRNGTLGLRLILPAERLAEIPAEQLGNNKYHAHRISLGVPDAGLDYPLANTFPHEALYDQLHSIDFKKGCFIGQEVVSRMQHRGTARKRAIRITSNDALTAGSPVEAGEATIGAVGSSSGTEAIAMLRLDRASEATGKGIAIQAGDATLSLDPPEWITFDITSGKPAADA